MPRGILFFMVVWVLVSMGVVTFRHLSGQEKLSVVKLLLFSGATALIALGLVALVVFVF